MAALIALLAICLFATGAAVGIIGVVAVAIRREERNLTLTNAAPDQVASAGRWLNGLYVRAPRRTATGDPKKALAWPGQQAGPRTRRTGPLAGPPGRTPQGQHGLHRHEARQPAKIIMRATRISRMRAGPGAAPCNIPAPERTLGR
jgi:hypothetical protein